METRDILDFQGNIIGKLTLADNTSENQWQIALAPYAQPPPSVQDIVEDRLQNYQQIAPKVLTDLMTANVLAGITTQQSDQIFDDYADVILRIQQGAFPTAQYRLNQKLPQGFVTQELLDSWKALLASYL